MEYDLNRFIQAQERNYSSALEEIKNGKKVSHWMWYIFPQLKGMGRSYNSNYYGIADRKEAELYLGHPVLGSRLLEITQALLHLESNNAKEILGRPDDIKLRSCMTLFSRVSETDTVFKKVLSKFYGSDFCNRTLQKLTDKVE